jgi:hypothetical protein
MSMKARCRRTVKVEDRVGVGRGAGGSRRQECGRWIEDPRPNGQDESPRCGMAPTNESPPRSRSAIEWLLERARGTLLLNIREKFENGKSRGTHLLNNFWGSPACWRARATGGEDQAGRCGLLTGPRRRERNRPQTLCFLGDNTWGVDGRTGCAGVDYLGLSSRANRIWLPNLLFSQGR